MGCGLECGRRACERAGLFFTLIPALSPVPILATACRALALAFGRQSGAGDRVGWPPSSYRTCGLAEQLPISRGVGTRCQDTLRTFARTKLERWWMLPSSLSSFTE